MRRQNYSTKELANLSIKSYLDYSGISYDAGGNFVKLRDHNSLVVDLKHKMFNWNSQGKDGNLYNFIREYEGLSVAETWKKLQEFAQNPSSHVKDVPVVGRRSHGGNRLDETAYRQNIYPGQADTSEVRKYLQDTRKLSPILVTSMIDAGYIRELKNHAAFFAWFDKDGKEVGGNQQGTWIDHKEFGRRGTLKKDAMDSRINTGFNFETGTGGDNLYVFESPIDALSYFQLHAAELSQTNNSFLSLDGAGSKIGTVSRYAQEYHQELFKQVHLCLDNDNAGKMGELEYLDQYNSLYGQPVVEVPLKGKDWNEQLTSGFGPGHTQLSAKEFLTDLAKVPVVQRDPKLDHKISQGYNNMYSKSRAR